MVEVVVWVVLVVVGGGDVSVGFEFEIFPIAVAPVTTSYMSSVQLKAGCVSALPNMAIGH